MADAATLAHNRLTGETSRRRFLDRGEARLGRPDGAIHLAEGGEAAGHTSRGAVSTGAVRRVHESSMHARISARKVNRSGAVAFLSSSVAQFLCPGLRPKPIGDRQRVTDRVLIAEVAW